GGGQMLGASTVAVGGALAGIYAINRLRRHSKTQALLDTLPPARDVGIEDNTAEPANDVYDPAEVTLESATQLEDLRFDELYQLDHQHDSAGHSYIRKPELLAALLDADPNQDIRSLVPNRMPRTDVGIRNLRISMAQCLRCWSMINNPPWCNGSTPAFGAVWSRFES